MNLKEFLDRFPKEIGRTKLRDKDEHHVYQQAPNGEVGVWITNTRTTEGHGEQLFDDDAVNCVEWCQQQKSWAERMKREELGRRR